MIIHERYIKCACIIREKYLLTIEEIESVEKDLEIHKNKIKELLDKGTEFVSENEKLGLNEIKQKLSNELMEIDKNINYLNDKINPYLEKLESLEKESLELYRSIKDKYPNLSETDIQEQIFKSIKR